MSEDHEAPSFGEPNAQPATPRHDPTAFPLSVFETPKNNHATFEDSSGWTPRFAEEYSVFNSTPGNLRGGQGPFPDFSAPSPYQPTPSHKRLLSTESIAAGLETHANHFSLGLNSPLQPVEPSRRLQATPTEPSFPGSSPIHTESHENPRRRSTKKARRGVSSDSKGQIATPPPSARKGERRLAPKLNTPTMQNDGFEQDFVVETPHQQHQNVAGFITTPTDMFGVPLSVPATASAFWDPGMSGMDLDFNTTANLFTTTGHRPMNSLDWGKSNEFFQETGVLPPVSQSEEIKSPSKSQRALAPKPPMPTIDTSMTDASLFNQSFTTAVDDPFAMISQGGGVDPGLLFTQPPLPNVGLAMFDPMAELSSSQPMLQPQLEPRPLPKFPKRGQGRRPASNMEVNAGKKVERVTVSSPIKTSSARPGLSRSFSESRGRKPTVKTSNLPNLAQSAWQGPHSAGAIRPTSQGSRAGGRLSPLKSHHHQRLSSLSSIPELAADSRTRASVKFSIDSRGRATVINTDGCGEEEVPSPTLRPAQRGQRSRSRNWESSEEEDESSTDDEPIIIPSRNSSFALPNPHKPSLANSASIWRRQHHSSQRSFSEQNSASSLGIFYSEQQLSQNEAESEAETVMNGVDNNSTDSGKVRGDALSELRKVVEGRQKKGSAAASAMTLDTNQCFVPGPYSANSTISPTTLTEASLPTPSKEGGNQIRCVCNTTSSQINGDGYMVQCGSCEMWLHGKCTNITRKTLPHIYICKFCGQTPSTRGGSSSSTRGPQSKSSRATASSPLAHKSFKSFR